MKFGKVKLCQKIHVANLMLLFYADDGLPKRRKKKRELKADVDEGLTVFIR